MEQSLKKRGVNTKKVNSLGKPRLFLALVGYEDSKHHRRLKNPNQTESEASEDSAVGAFAVAVP